VLQNRLRAAKFFYGHPKIVPAGEAGSEADQDIPP
jgi:hypothetical protein